MPAETMGTDVSGAQKTSFAAYNEQLAGLASDLKQQLGIIAEENLTPTSRQAHTRMGALVTQIDQLVREHQNYTRGQKWAGTPFGTLAETRGP